MDTPKLPKGRKPKLAYESNEYLTLVWWNLERIEYYLWDRVSPQFNHILVYPRLTPTPK